MMTACSDFHIFISEQMKIYLKDIPTCLIDKQYPKKSLRIM